MANPYRDPISLIRSGSWWPLQPAEVCSLYKLLLEARGEDQTDHTNGFDCELAKLCGTPRGSLVMRFGTTLASALDPSCESFDEPARALRFGHLFGVPLHSQEQQIRSLEGFDAPVTADGGTV